MNYGQYIDNMRLIDKFCQSYNIKNYIINSDGSIDVNGSVNLRHENRRSTIIERIPIKFNAVYGDFDVSYNNIKNLNNFPRFISGSLICRSNRLETLSGSVKYANSIIASNNRISSLVGCPKVLIKLDVDHNLLTNLVGCPEGIEVSVNSNRLKSLRGLNNSKILRLDTSYLPYIIRNSKIPYFIDSVCKWQNEYSIWDNNDSLNMYRFNEMIRDIESDCRSTIRETFRPNIGVYMSI